MLTSHFLLPPLLMKLYLSHRLLCRRLLIPTLFIGIYYYCDGTIGSDHPTLWDTYSSSSSSFSSDGSSDGSSVITPPRYEVCPMKDTICPVDNICCGHLCLSGGTIDDSEDHYHHHNITNTNATCCTDHDEDDDDPLLDHDSFHQVMTMTTTTTGCGVNYMCSITTTNTTTSMCTVIHPQQHNDLPVQVPRTKLCYFTKAMTHIYAIPILPTPPSKYHDETNKEAENDAKETLQLRRSRSQSKNGPNSDKNNCSTPTLRVPMAAYLSNMGPIHEDKDDATTFINVTRVVILIHGSKRNVEDYLCCVNAAIPKRATTTSSDNNNDTTSNNNNNNNNNDDDVNGNNEILIVAPWFPTAEDGIINVTTTKSQYNVYNGTIDQRDILRWIGNNNDPFSINHIFHTWRYGAGAIQYPNISSFNVVDLILAYYLYNRTKFPNLQHIVVTGHSAGGQYVQRWALLSNSIHDSRDVSDSSNVQSRSKQTNAASSSSSNTKYPVVYTVVANPKSYAYLDARRWMNASIISNSSMVELEFRIPTDSEISHCRTYNDWEWGFDRRSNDYGDNDDELVAPYVWNAITVAGGMNVIIQRYAQRNVIYLSGDEDILYNGDCNDHVQGPNRRTRSERYFQALQQYYPSMNDLHTEPDLSSRRPSHKHHRYIVPNVPHNHCLMYQSPQGQQALFGTIDDARTDAISSKLSKR